MEKCNCSFLKLSLGPPTPEQVHFRYPEIKSGYLGKFPIYGLRTIVAFVSNDCCKEEAYLNSTLLILVFCLGTTSLIFQILLPVRLGKSSTHTESIKRFNLKYLFRQRDSMET